MNLDVEAFLLLGLAAGLSLLIGAEREYFAKSAGIRTTMLVGLGSALFTIVSREGMWLLPGMTNASADGSRIAAQIVSGIGFLGAGLIFVRRGSVRGLTTAAGMWFVAAVGMAAGANLPWIAVFSTAMYLLVTVGVRPLSTHMPHSKSTARSMRVTYLDGHGILRRVMEVIGSNGIVVLNLHVLSADNSSLDELDDRIPSSNPLQEVVMDVQGSGRIMQELTYLLKAIEGVRTVEWRTNDEGD